MLKAIRLIFAFLVCSVAVVLPYRLRLVWGKAVSDFVHLPFRVFGAIGKFLLVATGTGNPFPRSAPEAGADAPPPPPSPAPSKDKVVILFSGGTDSTCVAALCALEYREIHLLTFHEHATRMSPQPLENVERLRRRFPDRTFVHASISTDERVRRLGYDGYFGSFRRHGFAMLSMPGFSSLSWHLAAVEYARRHGIRDVRDGMTNEMTHLPGHLPAVREVFRGLYASEGLTFSSPVQDWAVPGDQRYIDRLIVDRHGFAAAPDLARGTRTTGRYLYEQGIFPHPNVKGSLFDREMQHDCYPFVLYNIYVFWWARVWTSQAGFERRLVGLFREKTEAGRRMIHAS